jgi:nicotinamidase-related amidase
MFKTLLVIDYQNDFVSPDGKVAQAKGRDMLKRCMDVAPKIQKLIDEWHEKGLPVIFVMSDYSIENYSGAFKEYRSMGPYGNCALPGTWGHELFEITKNAEDHVVLKHFFDAFYETTLDEVLKNLGVTDLGICGINTDICVFHTAFGAAIRGYSVTIYEKATDTVTDSKEAFLRNMELVAGIEIL